MIIGSRIIFYHETSSTNTLALSFLRSEKLQEGTVFHAGYQTAGRGQPGNSWESDKGQNLLISVILYPEFIKPAEQFLISMAISLGICDFVKNYYRNCRIKWPNDIYAGNGKIAGILIENSVSGNEIVNSVVGIGFNINQTRFTSGPPDPVSLRMLTGSEHNIQLCLNQLLSHLDKRYKKLISGNHPDIRQDYNSSLYRHMEWHSFRSKSRSFSGRITSVSDSGLLQIEDQKGNINEFAFREIEFADKGFSSL